MSSGINGWQCFYEAANTFLGSPILVFEFLPNLEGISYQIANSNSRTEFLRSSLLVRDRVQLDQNETWLKHRSLFHDKFVVGGPTGWFVCYQDVWSPSVDAFFLIDEILKDNHRNSWVADSILDYGCGTGVVALSLARNFRSVKKVSLIDSNLKALQCSAQNLYLHGLEIDVELNNSCGGLRDYDIGIITPFYFPVEKTFSNNPLQRIQEAAVQSAEMVSQVFERCRKIYFVYSSTTSSIFEKTTKFDFKILSSLNVPFSLGDNVSNESFVSAALEAGLLTQFGFHGFEYSHQIIAAVAEH